MDAELVNFLAGNGLDNRHIQILKENDIDGYIFGMLLESDFDKMFTVGIVRRLLLQQEYWIKAQKAKSSCTTHSTADKSYLTVLDDTVQLRRADSMNTGPEITNSMELLKWSNQSKRGTSTVGLVQACNVTSTPAHNSGMSPPHIHHSSPLESESVSGTIKMGLVQASNVMLTPAHIRHSSPIKSEGSICTDSEQTGSDSTPDRDNMMMEAESNQRPLRISKRRKVGVPSLKSPLPKKPRRMTLPVFSKSVSDVLESGNVVFSINQIVYECARHILRNGDIRDKISYADFSQRLCERYPCLRYPGRSSWTHLTTKLSQKLRNMRLYESKRKTPLIVSIRSNSGTLNMTIDEANDKLIKEFEKKTPDWNHIALLCKHTFADRRQRISKDLIGIPDIFHEFPTLKNMRLIRADFKMLLPDRTLGEMRENYDKMMKSLCSMLQFEHIKEWSECDEVKILLALQAQLTDMRIRSRSEVCPINLQRAHSIELESKAMDPPHLVIAQHYNGHHQGWVLADEQCVPCHESDGIWGMIIDLISCYYAWNLSYPRDFLTLGFLQHVIVKENTNSVFRSIKFLNFQKAYDTLNNQ